MRNYEKLKPAYVSLKRSNQAWVMVHNQDSVAIEGQRKVIDWYKQSFAIEQELRQDADKKVILWRTKARRRGLIIGLGIGLPAAYGAYTLYRKLL